ncbi:MAG: excinuclease ABC subunit UvrB [Candidatus Magasanikbacteria bacterium]|nr:excinuclease ABC subunit UvrB [Candidatus Magasanikbacteria bacterium]
MQFKIKSKYQPDGDQPKAIERLVLGLEQGMRKQTLLGVTGSGKTFTMANVIQQVQMPTLVIAHNKTLAAQLCNEFREFFPDNAVEYFVSYYDYYQPEAYMPGSDTYIEKEAQVNEEIDRLRHACTQALLTRRDVIIVASVSAIYGLGSPKEYEKIVLHLRRGDELDRRAMLEQLVAMQFERTNSELKRGSFRLHGQVFEIMPVNEDAIYRFEISSHIDRIEKLDRVTRAVLASSDVDERGPSAVRGLRTNIRRESDVWFFPAKHYVVSEASRQQAFARIKSELDEQLAVFERQGKVLEYERLKRRVAYDLEMIKNIGYCNGIENYSRHFEGRAEGEPPFTLLDYFRYSATEPSPSVPLPRGEGKRLLSPRERSGEGMSRGFLTIIDESHVTVPQIRGMYNGDRARKDTLVEHGFRLPSARDNRPLQYKEFEERVGQLVYVSATPTPYEIKESEQVVEQVVRPTGLIDPEVVVRPITGKNKNVILSGAKDLPNRKKEDSSATPDGAQNDNLGKSQVEDLLIRIDERIKQGERVLVTTLTKKMAEDLTEYLKEKKIKVAYIHSDVLTLERIEIIMDLRLGKHDVLVGVNLLREGLDMPEVSLVAILDADKEGFLRSETSLIQTIGRAARNVNGQVVLYADNMTGSMERAIKETDRRRTIQLAYNKEHGITPKTIEKTIRNILEEFGVSRDGGNAKGSKGARAGRGLKGRTGAISTLDLDLLGDARPMEEIIKDKEKQMREAAKGLEFELAAILRDELRELRTRVKVSGTPKIKALSNKKPDRVVGGNG